MKTQIYTKHNQEIETGDIVSGNYNNNEIKGIVSRNAKGEFVVLTTQANLIDLRDLQNISIV